MIMEQEQKSIMGRCGSSLDQAWGDGPIKAAPCRSVPEA